MKVTKKAAEALWASVEVWSRKTEGAPHKHRYGTDACPCCQEYYDNSCAGCPIEQKTGDRLCEGTPYLGVEVLLDAMVGAYYQCDFVLTRTYLEDPGVFRKLFSANVQAEYEWLTDLACELEVGNE